MIGEHALAPLGGFVMGADRFGIESFQRRRILQIVQEEASLLRNLIERNRLNAQSGLFRGTVTGNFGGAQFWDRSWEDNSTRRALYVPARSQ